MTGHESDIVPVRLTNISAAPVWFFSFSPQWVPCGVLVRSVGSSQWEDITQRMCGEGSEFQKLDPGQSVLFKTWIPGNHAGQELSVKVDLFKAASLSYPLSVTSEGVLLR